MTGPYRSLSLWHDTLPEGEIRPRPPLEGPAAVDVVVVGAGYTGLWTAFYLLSHQPDLKLAVVEEEVAGFGASGRNGGWCAGEIAGNRDRIAAQSGRAAVVALWREMFATVDEVGKVCAAEGIDCHYQRGGILTFATNPAQRISLAQRLAEERSWGFDEEDFRWLERAEAEERARVRGLEGALFTPHAAAIHPARLARGLAEAVERRGGVIYEQTRATALEPGRVVTDRGSIKAGTVLRCTEVFSIELPGRRREYAPVYSLMIATEPLPETVWDDVGLAAREVFNDARHLIIYGQRTADGRFAFGGRGARYHFGSALRPDHERNHRVHERIERVLAELFPAVAGARITHRWGGAVAIPRDWRPSVIFDPATRVGKAGGYVGEGVAASNLAGRTLADLVLGRDTHLVGLPWVGHRSPSWEGEPWRWLGINAGLVAVKTADWTERRRGRPSRLLGQAISALTGR
jgi:glycine/D-amino acid oxidase-like deaminating enzyme